MSEKVNTRGGKRENAGMKPLDGEKREYRYFLTLTEKEIIDSYRASKGLDK